MIRRPPRSTQSRSSAASDVYKRQAVIGQQVNGYIQLMLHHVQPLTHRESGGANGSEHNKSCGLGWCWVTPPDCQPGCCIIGRGDGGSHVGGDVRHLIPAVAGTTCDRGARHGYQWRGRLTGRAARGGHIARASCAYASYHDEAVVASCQPIMREGVLHGLGAVDDGAGVFPTLGGETLGEHSVPVSYTHLRAHETVLDLVCRLLLEKKKYKAKKV
eukprot:TRINITY_DN24100_c0_g1_i1.p1 TRINITY_DN24100_c0_g1~~TRINITY_DN24100_c0_g1_i1.p1  ORF type:complete len:216 (-),score=61.07 TRINITY_DN24100_c0_g1_i1:64-711(-)